MDAGPVAPALGTRRVAAKEKARKFHFLRQIASGGFGRVYLAKAIHADGFSRLVAIKLLHRRWSENEEIASRMRDEARLLGVLRHRNIVDVMDLTMIDGRCAIVMEYLEAVDARALIGALREGDIAIPLSVALEIAAGVAAALDAAYNRPPFPGERPLRVIHRDIKPSNIMVDDSGGVKVLDFGVARAEFDAREAKTAELSFGSLEYMPPERLFFEPESAGSDIYSLGTTLYELIGGEKLGKAKLRSSEQERFVRSRFDDLRQRVSIPDETAAQLAPFILNVLAFEEATRPSAADAGKRMRELARLGAGPSLAEWAEAVVPPMLQRQRDAQQDEELSLVGSFITEDLVVPQGGPTSLEEVVVSHLIQPELRPSVAPPPSSGLVDPLDPPPPPPRRPRNPTLAPVDDSGVASIPSGDNPTEDSVLTWGDAGKQRWSDVKEQSLRSLSDSGEVASVDVDSAPAATPADPLAGDPTAGDPSSSAAPSDAQAADRASVKDSVLGNPRPVPKGEDEALPTEVMVAIRDLGPELMLELETDPGTLPSLSREDVLAAVGLSDRTLPIDAAQLPKAPPLPGVVEAVPSSPPTPGPTSSPPTLSSAPVSLLPSREPHRASRSRKRTGVASVLVMGALGLVGLGLLFTVTLIGGAGIAAWMSSPSVVTMPAPDAAERPTIPSGAIPVEGSDADPAALAAVVPTRFVSELTGTRRISVRCDSGAGSGVAEVALPAGVEGDCTVTAVGEGRARRTAVIKAVEQRAYVCFAGDSSACE